MARRTRRRPATTTGHEPTSSPSQRPPTSSTTKHASGEEVRLLGRRLISPGRHLLTWSAPDLARRFQPGQFAHVLAPRHPGLLLPVVPVAGADRVAGSVELLLDEREPGLDGLLQARDGDGATLDGPLGRGFEVDPRSRFLLVVADDVGLARVRAAVQDAVSNGRQVTVLVGAASVASVAPSSLLPDEAEYMVATADGSLGHHGRITDLVPRYEAWADQCFAAGSGGLLRAMATLARGRDGRLGVARLGRRRGRKADASATAERRRAWLQVALPHPVGCDLGVCLGCAVNGTDGPVRVCREGPAFAASELRWDAAS